MGQLLNGVWTEDQPFAPGPHHNKLGTKEFPFDASDKGRYHLYLSQSCPFAHRAYMALVLKRLGSVVNVSFTNPGNTDNGWSFAPKGFGPEADIGDKVLGKSLLHEVYATADPDYTGRVTVPLLIDTKPGSHSLGGSGPIRIVSNESLEIVDQFNKFGTGIDLDAHSEEQKKPTELFEAFHTTFFKLAKIQTQADYDACVEGIYKAAQDFDDHLATRKFLASDSQPTKIDLITFPVLIRFDAVFALLFRITRARLLDYPNLGNYIRRVYQYDSLRDTIDIDLCSRGGLSDFAGKKFTTKPTEWITLATPRLNLDAPVR